MQSFTESRNKGTKKSEETDFGQTLYHIRQTKFRHKVCLCRRIINREAKREAKKKGVQLLGRPSLYIKLTNYFSPRLVEE